MTLAKIRRGISGWLPTTGSAASIPAPAILWLFPSRPGRRNPTTGPGPYSPTAGAASGRGHTQVRFTGWIRPAKIGNCFRPDGLGMSLLPSTIRYGIFTKTRKDACGSVRPMGWAGSNIPPVYFRFSDMTLRTLKTSATTSGRSLRMTRALSGSAPTGAAFTGSSGKPAALPTYTETSRAIRPAS